MTKRNSRNEAGIRIWMLRNRVRVIDIARGIRPGFDPSLVVKTIQGKRNNRKVLAYLKGLGCPTRLLAIPVNSKQGESAC